MTSLRFILLFPLLLLHTPFSVHGATKPSINGEAPLSCPAISSDDSSTPEDSLAPPVQLPNTAANASDLASDLKDKDVVVVYLDKHTDQTPLFSALQKARSVFTLLLPNGEKENASPPARAHRTRSHEAMESPNSIEEMDVNSIQRTVTQGKVQYTIQSGRRTEPLRMDSTGYILNAQDKFGRQMGEKILESYGQALIMIDVNYLGILNHFPDGYAGGDNYLASVAKVVGESTGDRGIPMRWGGDEFVIALDTTNVETIQDLQKTIIDGVTANPEANAIFRRNLQRHERMLNIVEEAQSFDDLSPEFIESLKPNELEFALADFENFRSSAVKVQSKAVYDAEALAPSVSIGSVLFEDGDIDKALSLADKTAGISKTIYKGGRGIPGTKYTGRDSYLPKNSANDDDRDIVTPPPSQPVVILSDHQ